MHADNIDYGHAIIVDTNSMQELIPDIRCTDKQATELSIRQFFNNKKNNKKTIDNFLIFLPKHVVDTH